MDAKLKIAVEIFKSLGWEDVSPENILTLPIGTPEQKRDALAGLKSGWWGGYDEKLHRWHDYFDMGYKVKLVLFAIRVGVTARRANEIIPLFHTNKDMLFAAIKSRGLKFADDYLALLGEYFQFEDYQSKAGNAKFFLRLINELDLAIPQNVNYLNRWANCAAAAMGVDWHYANSLAIEFELDLNTVKQRFPEHIRAGVDLKASATGPWGFANTLTEGVKHEFFPRDEAVDLIFSALDTAVRPNDRVAWISALNALEIRDEEFVMRIQALIPILSLGDAAVIERIAPVLIANADKSLLTEVLLAAFSVTTKKAKKLLLKSALAQDCPENAEEISPWISIFAGDKDKSISTLANKLAEKWKIGVESFDEEESVEGLWQETPPVWEVPDFELGEVSAENLTELAAMHVSHPAIAHDTDYERFLAMINAVAYQNSDEARAALSGLRGSVAEHLYFVRCWLMGEKSNYGSDEYYSAYDSFKRFPQVPLNARNYVVTANFGKLPCVLSMPSKVDLTITVPDLVARLELYKKTETNIQEADLFLALTRLDVDTATPENREALQNLKIPIKLQSGKYMKRNLRAITAGKAVLNYLDNPLQEPPMEASKWEYRWQDVSVDVSFAGFPNRLHNHTYTWENATFPSTFPSFGDIALRSISANYDSFHEQGLIMRQVARRAKPLPAGAAVNFLASMRSPSHHAAEDASWAVKEAWERGLLRPDVADVKYLDWSEDPPSNLAALATALDDIARNGILSVVWPLLDELIGASLAAPRLLAGTAEIAEVIATFLPEVQRATENNLADKIALDLPNIRVLAKRGGSSRAVTTAKKISELLPPPIQQETPVEAKEIEMNPPFDEIWKTPNEGKIIEDGVKVTVDWAQEKKSFLFRLILPETPEQEFHVAEMYSHHSIEHQGHITATPTEINAPYKFTGQRGTWVTLYWDTKQKNMVATEMREWKNSSRNKRTPLTASLLTIFIGLFAQDNNVYYHDINALKNLIKRGEINAQVVRNTTVTLLQSPIVSPAKLSRPLEKDITLLPIFWPMLTECIKFAGEQKKPPVWINRILDISLHYAPYLKEATKRGLIPDWQGLEEIANLKS
ncbi:MAG: hypothetical protein FWC89_09820, partial [Defluviitaleaceae bacterium]|nr:hypothetical protein [Defluviitaleaceae bacterium]